MFTAEQNYETASVALSRLLVVARHSQRRALRPVTARMLSIRRRRAHARPSDDDLSKGIRLQQGRCSDSTRIVAVCRRMALLSMTGFLALLAKRFCSHMITDVRIEHVRHCSTLGWRNAPRRKVFDAFPVNSEIDILMARLHELNETVDRFVIVESMETFSGKVCCCTAQACSRPCSPLTYMYRFVSAGKAALLQ